MVSPLFLQRRSSIFRQSLVKYHTEIMKMNYQQGHFVRQWGHKTTSSEQSYLTVEPGIR